MLFLHVDHLMSKQTVILNPESKVFSDLKVTSVDMQSSYCPHTLEFSGNPLCPFLTLSEAYFFQRHILRSLGTGQREELSTSSLKAAWHSWSKDGIWLLNGDTIDGTSLLLCGPLGFVSDDEGGQGRVTIRDEEHSFIRYLDSEEEALFWINEIQSRREAGDKQILSSEIAARWTEKPQ